MLEIRRLTPDQWPVWRRVRLRALEDAPAAFGASLADWTGSGDAEERWRGRLTDVDANYVAYVDGEPSGQVSGARTVQPDRVELISMWVAPEARGLGISSALIDAVEGWAIELGAESLALSVKLDNAPAISLYRRHGFERTVTPVADGEFEMVKRLGG